MPNEDITLLWVSSAVFCEENGSNSLLPAMFVGTAAGALEAWALGRALSA